MVARGDRPGYRLVVAQDGSWTIDAMSWLLVVATTRSEAIDAVRAAITEWLDVPPEAFDVEAS